MTQTFYDAPEIVSHTVARNEVPSTRTLSRPSTRGFLQSSEGQLRADWRAISGRAQSAASADLSAKVFRRFQYLGMHTLTGSLPVGNCVRRLSGACEIARVLRARGSHFCTSGTEHTRHGFRQKKRIVSLKVMAEALNNDVFNDHKETIKALEFPPPPSISKGAHVSSREQYDEMYQQSISNPDAFWGDIAKSFYWKKEWQNPVRR